MTRPQVSVLTAVHNGERYLEESVLSILGQRFTDFEFIVVDDGSTDGTAACLERLRSREPRLIVVHQPHRGLTPSLNAAVRIARGTYWARHDADDVSPPDRLERQLQYLATHPTVGAVGCGGDVIDAWGAVVCRLPVQCGIPAVRRQLMRLNTAVFHSSVMMRPEAFERAGGYREAFPVAQDLDLWFRMAEHDDLDNLPGMAFRWRLSPSGVYATRREFQLKYSGIAMVFARERRTHGVDSYDLLRACAGDLEAFAAAYRDRGLLQAVWGELMFRGLRDVSRARRHLGSALRNGFYHPKTLGLFGWSLLGLGWPGGVPLSASMQE